MGMSFRRVIQPPAEKSDAKAGPLADRLARSVQLQRELAARSPHILQFTSDLQTDESGFFVEHEPATPHRIPVFDANATPGTEEELLRWTIALADALRAAHDHTDRVVHGGLCPGTMLTTPDGIEKITDFGFAPSICAELGVDEYINLCLQSAEPDNPEAPWTGRWKVIPPDMEHDDRICGFIDPRKYGDQTLHTFEPGSDVISAGFLLHLMAELRHPYLNDNQDLRLPELAEGMAYFFYDGSRRNDLQNSSDPRIQAWCEVLAKMLEHLANDRPTAAHITSTLADVGVRPHSLEQAQETELKDIADLLAGQSFEDALGRSRSLAGSAVSNEIREHAAALQRAAKNGIAVLRAAERLGTDDWRLARDELRDLDRTGLAPDLGELLEETERTLQSHQQLDERLTTMEATLDEKRGISPSSPDDARAIDDAMGALEAALSQIDVASAPVSFRSRKDSLQHRLDQRRQELRQMLAAIDADTDAAREWLTNLEEAVRSDDRGKVRSMLAERGQMPITHWPGEVLSAAEAIGKRVDSAERAETWILSFRELVEQSEADASKLSHAQSFGREKPATDDWPAALKEELKAIERRLQAVEMIVADRTVAENWIGGVRQAVEQEEWATAKSALNARPSLSEWPEDVTAEAQRLKPLIDEHLEEQEVVEVWLSSIREALDSRAFARAMELAQVPPVQGKKLPKKAKKQAEQWASLAKSKLAEQKKKALEERTEWVKSEVDTLIRQGIVEHLDNLVAIDLVETAVKAIEWHSTDIDTTGHGEVTVSVRFQESGDAQRVLRDTVEFACADGTPRLNNGTRLRDRVVEEMRRAVEAQQARAANALAKHFQNGLFPEATVATSLKNAVERIQAEVSFLGTKDAEASLKTDLVWDTGTGNWAFAEPETVAQRAVEVAISRSQDSLKPQVLKNSDTLRKYDQALQTSITAPRVMPPPIVPTTITFEGNLLFAAENEKPTSLLTFVVDCRRVGEIEIKSDLGPAEARLNEIITVRQQTAQADVQKGLEERFKAGSLKCKLTPAVKRIKSPVDAVGFLVNPRRGPKVTLQARWNRDRLVFELGSTEEETIKTLMNGAAKTVAPTPRRKKATANGEPTSGKRPAVVVVGGLVAVAGVAAAFVFWPKADVSTNGDNSVVDVAPVVNDNENRPDHSTPGTPDKTTPDNTSANGNTDSVDGTAHNGGSARDTSNEDSLNDATPPDTANRAHTEALSRIRSELAKSRYLAPYVEDLVSADASGNVIYTVPGLQAPTRPVRLEVENNVPVPSPDEMDQIVQDRADLTRRLDTEPGRILAASLARVLANDDFDRVLDTGVVSLGDVAPNWTLEPTRKRHWVGEGGAVSINLSAGKSVRLTGFRFELSNGVVSVGAAASPTSGVNTAQLDGFLRNTFRSELARLMDDARTAWLEGLNPASLPATSLEFDIGASGDMRLDPTVRLSGPDLATREFHATWNPLSLQYEPAVDWAQTAGDFSVALSLIHKINDSNNPPSWRSQVPSVGAFHETKVSPPGELRVVARFPWADDRSDDPADLFESRIALSDDQGEPPMPAVWPLLAKYDELSRTPELTAVGKNGETSRPWTDLPAELQPLIEANLEYTRLVASFPGKPRLTQDGDGRLDVRAVIRFEAATAVDVLTPEAITAGLRNMTASSPLAFDLSLVRDRQYPGGVRIEWAAVDPLIDASALVRQVGLFDGLLMTYSDRNAVERELRGKVGSIAEGEAMRLLDLIWDVKLGPNRDESPPSMADLSQGIVQEDLFYEKVGDTDFDPPLPTLLAEYFCGPERCLAVGWSLTWQIAKSQPLIGEVWVVDLGKASAILMTLDNAGSRLFDPLIGRFPNAVAGYDRTVQRQGAVGLVFGLDEPLDLLTDPARLQVRATQSELEPLDRTFGPPKEKLTWNKLTDLKEAMADYRSDYALLVTLGDPSVAWSALSDPTERLAKQQAYQAYYAAVDQVGR